MCLTYSSNSYSEAKVRQNGFYLLLTINFNHICPFMVFPFCPTYVIMTTLPNCLLELEGSVYNAEKSSRTFSTVKVHLSSAFCLLSGAYFLFGLMQELL